MAPRARLIRHWPLTEGVSAHIEALELAPPDEPSRVVVVRRYGAADWKQHHADVTSAEFMLPTCLHIAGLAVPEPLLLDASAGLLSWIGRTQRVAFL